MLKRQLNLVINLRELVRIPYKVLRTNALTWCRYLSREWAPFVGAFIPPGVPMNASILRGVK